MTDLCAASEAIPFDEKFAAHRSGWQAHHGIIKAALYIQKILDEEKLLEKAFTKDSLKLLEDIRYYMQFALAVYGWSFYLSENRHGKCCKLLSAVRCCGCVRQSPVEHFVEKDNCCFCDSSALRLTLPEWVEITYANFHCGVFQTPFFIAIDHDRQNVVLCLRGTLSLRDLMTDLCAASEAIPFDEKFAAHRSGWQAHHGIIKAALYIQKILDEEKLLEKAFTKLKDDGRLLIVGHSLGGGTAAVLGLMLRDRPQYANLHAYVFSPPGGLMTRSAAEECAKFMTGCVVGKDVVPRLGLAQMEVTRHELIALWKTCKDTKSTMDEDDRSEESSDEEQLDEAKAIIDNLEYYHGFILIDDADELLNKHGDFLVHRSSLCEHEEIVLSMCWFDSHKHVLIPVNHSGYFTVANVRFETVQDLIRYHWNYRRNIRSAAVSCHESPRLFHPIARPSWQLLLGWFNKKRQIYMGNMGMVWEGQLKKPADSSPKCVAIKVCNAENVRRNRQFMKAARLLRQLDHPNVITFYGVYCLDLPCQIVTELPEERSLNLFFKDHSDISLKQRVSFCADVSRAMEYIHSKTIIHIDLAGRNCLITGAKDKNDDVKYCLKLGDFGLCQKGPVCDVTEYEIPKLWCAPELLADEPRIATSNSDVWSLGVVLWEIFENCIQPYCGLVKPDDLLVFLVNGNRLDIPSETPDAIGKIMKECWNLMIKSRPPAARIVNQVEMCLKSM